MSTKHKPGIVGIWMHMDANGIPREAQFRHKSQIAIRMSEKNTKKTQEVESTERAWQRSYSQLQTPIPFHRMELPWCLLGGNFCMQRLPLGDWNVPNLFAKAVTIKTFRLTQGAWTSSILSPIRLRIWMFHCFALDEDFLLVMFTALANLNSECHWQKTSPVAPGFHWAAENLFKPAMYWRLPCWSCRLCSFQTPYFMFEFMNLLHRKTKWSIIYQLAWKMYKLANYQLAWKPWAGKNAQPPDANSQRFTETHRDSQPTWLSVLIFVNTGHRTPLNLIPNDLGLASAIGPLESSTWGCTVSSFLPKSEVCLQIHITPLFTRQGFN